MNRPTPGPEGAALAATLAELAGAGDLAVLTQYNPAPGLAHQRAAMAEFLSHVGLEATADEMILTSGAQHAMAACALGLLNAGDVILTEDLTYPGLTSLAAHLNVRVRGVAMDGEGLRPDALEAAVRDTGARVVYVTPVHQNPTTATMGAERLADIARVVRDHDLVVMEDDVYGFQAARREPPLQTLAPDNVIYISGFAKSVAPGLRVGCVKAPRTLFSTLTQTVQITGWMTAPLMGEIATRWIADGTAAELIRWHRDEMIARNRMALEAFQGMALQSQPESLHLWLDLPEGHHCVDCLQALTRAGVGVAGSHSFATQAGGSPRAVRLCLGSPTTRDELAEGLARVKSVLSAPPATQPTHCTPMVM